jgi:hypothetical protein
MRFGESTNPSERPPQSPPPLKPEKIDLKKTMFKPGGSYEQPKFEIPKISMDGLIGEEVMGLIKQVGRYEEEMSMLKKKRPQELTVERGETMEDTKARTAADVARYEHEIDRMKKEMNALIDGSKALKQGVEPSPEYFSYIRHMEEQANNVVEATKRDMTKKECRQSMGALAAIDTIWAKVLEIRSKKA